jgi:predicted Zn finger-like uncharacterized protein
MTQNSLQTQCPHCQTRFRVTDEQLGIAKGKVRCGNCMEVFNAVEHQVAPGGNQAGAATKSGDTASPSDTPPTDSAHATEEDFVFADNPEEDAADGPYAGSKLTFSDDELSDSFRTVDKTDTMDFQDPDDDISHHDVDESWAEAILEDDKRQTPEPEPAEKQSLNEPEPEQEPEPEEPAWPEQSPESPFAATPDASPAENFHEPRAEETDFFTEPAIAPEQPAEPDEPQDPVTAGVPFNDLRREPLSVGSSGNGKWRTAVWSLIVLALAGVLIAQVTWFQFDRLSAIPELRPLYEKACQFTGCQLKPLVNIDAIQSRKLVVRTDPENRGHLLVDAVIINRADFEQPFPAIALTFSNLNGDVVAQSVFTPDEYLAGEGRSLTSMPKETPVRIAISIRDPGRDAVNYNIQFRPVPH